MSTEAVSCPSCDNQIPVSDQYCLVCGTANPRWTPGADAPQAHQPASSRASQQEEPEFDLAALFADPEPARQDHAPAPPPAPPSSDAFDLMSLFGDDTEQTPMEEPQQEPTTAQLTVEALVEAQDGEPLVAQDELAALEPIDRHEEQDTTLAGTGVSFDHAEIAGGDAPAISMHEEESPSEPAPEEALAAAAEDEPEILPALPLHLDDGSHYDADAQDAELEVVQPVMLHVHKLAPLEASPAPAAPDESYDYDLSSLFAGQEAVEPPGASSEQPVPAAEPLSSQEPEVQLWAGEEAVKVQPASNALFDLPAFDEQEAESSIAPAEPVAAQEAAGEDFSVPAPDLAETPSPEPEQPEQPVSFSYQDETEPQDLQPIVAAQAIQSESGEPAEQSSERTPDGEEAHAAEDEQVALGTEASQETEPEPPLELQVSPEPAQDSRSLGGPSSADEVPIDDASFAEEPEPPDRSLTQMASQDEDEESLELVQRELPEGNKADDQSTDESSQYVAALRVEDTSALEAAESDYLAAETPPESPLPETSVEALPIERGEVGETYDEPLSLADVEPPDDLSAAAEGLSTEPAVEPSEAITEDIELQPAEPDTAAALAPSEYEPEHAEDYGDAVIALPVVEQADVEQADIEGPTPLMQADRAETATQESEPLPEGDVQEGIEPYMAADLRAVGDLEAGTFEPSGVLLAQPEPELAQSPDVSGVSFAVQPDTDEPVSAASPEGIDAVTSALPGTEQEDFVVDTGVSPAGEQSEAMYAAPEQASSLDEHSSAEVLTVVETPVEVSTLAEEIVPGGESDVAWEDTSQAGGDESASAPIDSIGAPVVAGETHMAVPASNLDTMDAEESPIGAADLLSAQPDLPDEVLSSTASQAELSGYDFQDTVTEAPTADDLAPAVPGLDADHMDEVLSTESLPTGENFVEAELSDLSDTPADIEEISTAPATLTAVEESSQAVAIEAPVAPYETAVDARLPHFAVTDLAEVAPPISEMAVDEEEPGADLPVEALSESMDGSLQAEDNATANSVPGEATSDVDIATEPSHDWTLEQISPQQSRVEEEHAFEETAPEPAAISVAPPLEGVTDDSEHLEDAYRSNDADAAASDDANYAAYAAYAAATPIEEIVEASEALSEQEAEQPELPVFAQTESAELAPMDAEVSAAAVMTSQEDSAARGDQPATVQDVDAWGPGEETVEANAEQPALFDQHALEYEEAPEPEQVQAEAQLEPDRWAAAENASGDAGVAEPGVPAEDAPVVFAPVANIEPLVTEAFAPVEFAPIDVAPKQPDAIFDAEQAAPHEAAAQIRYEITPIAEPPVQLDVTAPPTLDLPEFTMPAVDELGAAPVAKAEQVAVPTAQDNFTGGWHDPSPSISPAIAPAPEEAVHVTSPDASPDVSETASAWVELPEHVEPTAAPLASQAASLFGELTPRAIAETPVEVKAEDAWSAVEPAPFHVPEQQTPIGSELPVVPQATAAQEWADPAPAPTPVAMSPNVETPSAYAYSPPVSPSASPYTSGTDRPADTSEDRAPAEPSGWGQPISQPPQADMPFHHDRAAPAFDLSTLFGEETTTSAQSSSASSAEEPVGPAFDLSSMFAQDDTPYAPPAPVPPPEPSPGQEPAYQQYGPDSTFEARSETVEEHAPDMEQRTPAPFVHTYTEEQPARDDTGGIWRPAEDPTPATASQLPGAQPLVVDPEEAQAAADAIAADTIASYGPHAGVGPRASAVETANAPVQKESEEAEQRPHAPAVHTYQPEPPRVDEPPVMSQPQHPAAPIVHTYQPEPPRVDETPAWQPPEVVQPTQHQASAVPFYDSRTANAWSPASGGPAGSSASQSTGPLWTPGMPRPKPGTPEYEEMARRAMEEARARRENTPAGGNEAQYGGSAPTPPSTPAPSWQAPPPQAPVWTPGMPRPKPGTPEYEEMARQAMLQSGINPAPAPLPPASFPPAQPQPAQQPLWDPSMPRPKPGTPEYEEMARRALNQRLNPNG